MSEFGHVGFVLDGFCIDSWGAGPFVIEASGKSFRFEDSDQFGPALITKNGDIASVQPVERSPFWKAHRLWVQQGRRLSADGITCAYTPAPPPRPNKYIRMGARSRYLVEAGDEDGEWIEVFSTDSPA